MKISKHIVFILLAMLAAACSKDDLVPDCPPPTDDVNGLIEMTFTATAALHTRTMLGEKDADGEYPVLWTAGDEIAVMPRITNGKDYAQSDIAKMKFTTSIEEGETAETATFTGSTYASDGGYAAFYPHRKLTSYNGNMYNNVFYFTLPAEQDAVAGSFAPNLCPAFVLTEGNVENLSFSPLCGLVKFSLSGDVVSDLASVRFEAAGQPLTGELGCNAYYRLFDNNTSPISHVTLTGTFVAGDDYYMVVVPCYLGGGFSFTFTRKDGSVYVKEGKIEDYYLDSGRIGNFGNIDLSEATFATPSDDDITDMAFIKAVESSTGIALERNDAGYVPLTEGNLELMASVKNLDISNKALTDASALKYFTGLQTLNFSDNNLSELDVSELTNLTDLDCDGNKLTTLDVSGLTSLTLLDCYDNQLMTLDVSELTNLTSLACDMNQLTTLDVSELTALEELYCYGNRLTTLDISGLSLLEDIYCGKQTSDGTTQQTLTLTAAQRDGVWAQSNLYDYEKEYNTDVELKVRQ